MRNGNTVILTSSTISGNSGGAGGGLFNETSATLVNSTVSGNSAGGGGGVFNTGDLSLTNSTISKNSAASNGGGVYNFYTATLGRSMISGNTAAQGAEMYHSVDRNPPGTVTANNFNLFGHSGLTDAQAFSGFSPGATDLTATSNGDVSTPLGAILDTTLANNGGPTKTHALVVGSPAVDAVQTGCPPPAKDQRGVTRPQDGDEDTLADCDVGAFELEPPPPQPRSADLALSLTGTPALVTVNGQLTYTINVRNNGPAAATDVQVTDALHETMLLATASATQGSCGGTRTVSCELDTLVVGAQATVTIKVTPTQSGSFSNTASVIRKQTDPVPANDSDRPSLDRCSGR